MNTGRVDKRGSVGDDTQGFRVWGLGRQNPPAMKPEHAGVGVGSSIKDDPVVRLVETASRTPASCPKGLSCLAALAAKNL